VRLVILVDDGSTDETLEVARQLGLEIFVHNRNYGYGANQKTCYAEALRAGADIVVMVHPDYQYDPRLVPQIIEPLVRGEADVVLGSRLKSGSALAHGMPWWKYIANRFLTGAENRVFRLSLSEYHTGYRAFRREVLETVNFVANSDGFVFDQEIIAQVVAARFKIAEIAVPTRYFPEASSAGFLASVVYGLRILAVLFWFTLNQRGVRRSRRFDSLRARYTRQDRGDGDPAPDLREDVLGARHPPEVAAGGGPHVREREPHLRGVLEDRFPRRAHRFPADQERPARMHALHMLAVRPHEIHPREVERLERLIEARVRLLDLGEVGRHGPAGGAVVSVGRRTTSVSPSSTSGNAVSR